MTITKVVRVCCEGGPLTAGCYHDNCTGAKLKSLIKSKKD